MAETTINITCETEGIDEIKAQIEEVKKVLIVLDAEITKLQSLSVNVNLKPTNPQ